MKKAATLILASLLIGAVQVVEHRLYEGDVVYWNLSGYDDEYPDDYYYGYRDTYAVRGWTTLEESWLEWSNDIIPVYHLCIEMNGWNGAGWPEPPRYEKLSSICLEKQYIAGYQGGEIPKLTIEGFHEIHIEGNWIYLDSEFGTIIDGEEAHTIFLPMIQR